MQVQNALFLFIQVRFIQPCFPVKTHSHFNANANFQEEYTLDVECMLMHQIHKNLLSNKRATSEQETFALGELHHAILLCLHNFFSELVQMNTCKYVQISLGAIHYYSK